ncbi:MULTISPECIES: hypothetical protein [Enterococcus]|uniref:hypothetical protein n=1 Tax=Enterococcus TaxID=1350 RepID=UPI00032DE3A1|nr:hypothetical protein [Enterococcus mundtii]EOH61233.1 hypothetical protein UAC_01797 [Enterococcus mundtii ATCC 882]EOU12494.1 hypothetical protein I587_01041 [Enterococcus mundtii ATCC 882]MDY4306981.1 hypothetical protein [Enterococcus mundtii]UBM06340.1 hypothetical protein K9N66_04080 [Enterococcus mundtii]GKS54315.1 hypothetical protein EMLAB_09300 [Enterococcus mundtii]
MKENVTLTELNKYTKIMLVFMLLTLISVGPSLFLPGNWRLALPLIFWIASMYGSIKVEGLKTREYQNLQRNRRIHGKQRSSTST